MTLTVHKLRLPGSYWQFLAVPGSSWQFLAVPGSCKCSLFDVLEVLTKYLEAENDISTGLASFDRGLVLGAQACGLLLVEGFTLHLLSGSFKIFQDILRSIEPRK